MLKHHLVFRPISADFWKAVTNWCNINVTITVKFTVCVILLGIPCSRNSHLIMINYLILLGKWYINENRTKDKPISFQDILAQLKSMLVVFHDFLFIKI